MIPMPLNGGSFWESSQTDTKMVSLNFALYFLLLVGHPKRPHFKALIGAPEHVWKQNFWLKSAPGLCGLWLNTG